MSREFDLLPWILGGLATAGIAVAVTVGLAQRTAPSKALVPVAAAAASTQPAMPLVAAAVAAAPIPGPAPAPDPALALEPVQPAGEAMAPSSQIWECTVNGQKTFSDKRCGGNAELREIRPINVMNPAPMLPLNRPYQADAGDAPDYYPDAQDYVDSGVPAMVGVPYYVHRRLERTHHPIRPHPVSMARRN